MPFDDTPVDIDVGGGSGPTAPAGGAGGGFLGDLFDIARSVVPGLGAAVNLAQRVGNFIGGIAGFGRPRSPLDTSIHLLETGSAYGNQISSRSALGQDPSDFPLLFTGTTYNDVWGGGGYEPPLEVPPIYRTNFIAGPSFSGEEASMIVPTASAPGPFDLAIPVGESIPRTLLSWLKRIAVAYGPAVANAVWIELQKRRRAGQSTTLAKAVIDEQYPVRGRIMRRGRRRMNPANIRALRRALRRVRSFRRVTRKVHGVFPTHRGGAKTVYRYRRPRRGDLWDVEDQADEFDEAEDLGYEPEFFREEAMVE